MQIYGREITYEIDGKGCHNCTSHSSHSGGYPRLNVNQKNITISREIYKLNYGEIPKDLVVRHKCDNRMCINLEHLELGTHADNTRDKITRKRQKKRQRNLECKII